MATPWAESYSRFTELTEPATGFERHIIDLLLISQNRSGVSRITGLLWDEVDHIMQRAVERGPARRDGDEIV